MKLRLTTGFLVLCLGLAWAQPAVTPSATPDPHGHSIGDGHDHGGPTDPHGHYAGDGHDHGATPDPHGHYAGDGHDHGATPDPHGHDHADEHNHSGPGQHKHDGSGDNQHREDLAVPESGHSHAGHNHDTEYVPSAQDASMPAVFGYMILATRAEKAAGTQVSRVLELSRGPWALTALLFPLYVLMAGRRGFRLRRRG